MEFVSDPPPPFLDLLFNPSLYWSPRDNTFPTLNFENHIADLSFLFKKHEWQ
jgi:hypothetical protein